MVLANGDRKMAMVGEHESMEDQLPLIRKASTTNSHLAPKKLLHQAIQLLRNTYINMPITITG